MLYPSDALPASDAYVLDAFCGGGGAGMGYSQAGFRVVGVDIEPQPRYPFEFVQADAMEFIARRGSEFDLIHTSPPCHAYTQLRPFVTRDAPDLVAIVRELLLQSNRPWVMENVPGSPLRNPLVLCGTMFGLGVRRHRLFECDPALYFPPAPCNHWAKVAANNGYRKAKGAIQLKETGLICVAGNSFSARDARLAMEIDWMQRDELSQAIPPAYTRWVGWCMRSALNF